MKLFLSLLLFVPGAYGQNVGIGTTTPAAKLEVRKAGRADIKIRSENFIDTTQLIFSNKNPGELGTDFIFSSNQEQGLRITTRSDLIPNNHDSIMLLTPQGMIGVNTINPTERLHVNGNLNITGTIKANGIDGQPNQVLMKNGSGNLAWGNMCEYKNFAVFNYSPSPQNWTIPAGVTKVMVEIWGGGGGGSAGGGGGGGGYGRTIFNVSTGSIIVIIGNGGASGITGQNSSVEYSFFTITAGGGEAADGISPGNGGFSGSSSTNVFHCYGFQGEDGARREEKYEQRSSTSFVRSIIGGRGGRGALTDHTSGVGGFRHEEVGTGNMIYNINSGNGNIPGGGGGGHNTAGSAGAAGMVVIHY